VCRCLGVHLSMAYYEYMDMCANTHRVQTTSWYNLLCRRWCRRSPFILYMSPREKTTIALSEINASNIWVAIESAASMFDSNYELDSFVSGASVVD